MAAMLALQTLMNIVFVCVGLIAPTPGV